jgi:hypothetical protein
MVSAQYQEQDSGEKLIDGKPAVWNIHFSDSKDNL